MTPGERPLDRRPIAARQWGASRAVAFWLARRGVSANAISLAGMVCGSVAGVALGATTWFPEFAALCWLLGAGLIPLRLIANMLDGMVAVETGTTSATGELYNEVPDRVSDTAILIGAGYAVGGSIELGYLAATAALLTAYIRALGKAAGAGSEFCGPMAKQQRMWVVVAVAVLSALAPSEAANLGGWGISAWGLLVVTVGSVVTAGRRLNRIANSLRRRS